MFLSEDAVLRLGLARVGRDVLIDEAALFFGASAISVGDRTRIDAHTLLSAGPGQITLGSNVHVAAGVYLYGAGGGITVGDYVNLSSRVAVYSASDDYVDGYLGGPTVPDDYKRVTSAPVVVGRAAIIGAGSVVLPGVTVGEGAAVGALSLVRRDVPAYAVAAGNPLRLLGERSAERLAQLVADYERSLGDVP